MSQQFGESKISLWDLTTGALRWEFTYDITHSLLVKIMDGKIAFSGIKSINTEDKYSIHLIDSQDVNKKKSHSYSQRIESFHSVIANHSAVFFGLITGGKIGKMNLDGSIEYFETNISLDKPSRLYASGDYLIIFVDQTLYSFHLKTKRTESFILPKLDLMKSHSQIVHFDYPHLIYGCWEELKNPVIHLIDIEKMAPKGQYVLDQLPESAFNLNYYHPSNLFKNMALYKHQLFFSFLHSIIVLDLMTKEHKILGQHHENIQSLSLEGEVLVSVSSSLFLGSQPAQIAQIKFWDVKSLSFLGEINFANLMNISVVFGKVFALKDKELVQFDYFDSKPESDIKDEKSEISSLIAANPEINMSITSLE